jgi:hypothetical protein
MTTYHILFVDSVALLARSKTHPLTAYKINYRLTAFPESREGQEADLNAVLDMGPAFIKHIADISTCTPQRAEALSTRRGMSPWTAFASWINPDVCARSISIGDVICDGDNAWLVTPIDLQLLTASTVEKINTLHVHTGCITA